MWPCPDIITGWAGPVYHKPRSTPVVQQQGTRCFLELLGAQFGPSMWIFFEQETISCQKPGGHCEDSITRYKNEPKLPKSKKKIWLQIGYHLVSVQHIRVVKAEQSTVWIETAFSFSFPFLKSFRYLCIQTVGCIFGRPGCARRVQPWISHKHDSLQMATLLRVPFKTEHEKVTANNNGHGLKGQISKWKCFPT